MADMTLADLAAEAGQNAAGSTGGAAAKEAVEAAEQSGSEFLLEMTKLLDEKGLIEPMLFGPEKAAELKEQTAEPVEAEPAAVDPGDIEVNAATIAKFGKGSMAVFGDELTLAGLVDRADAAVDEIEAQLGDGTTVAELVEICENNPDIVNSQLDGVLQ